MQPHRAVQRAGPLLLVLGLLIAGGTPAVAELSDDEFEAQLSTLQTHAKDAVDNYRAGEEDAALEDARTVREAFAFNGSGASPLEQKIKAVSAVAIGDRVKALSARLVAAIEAGDPVKRVASIGDELVPSLNRLVLVAQGKHAPATQRQLKADEAIDAAAEEVRRLVDEAVRLYEDGDATSAQQTATEAFFTYETNGLGPDTTVVDEPLENEVENLIKNFNDSRKAPGLADLIETNASLTEVQEKAREIHVGLDQTVEILKATKPPRDVGDANEDGTVTIVDALVTAQAALGIREKVPVMDANQDGSVTIVDALLIAQAALGIRSL